MAEEKQPINKLILGKFILAFIGLVLLSVGASMIYFPAGLMVAGAIILFDSWMIK